MSKPDEIAVPDYDADFTPELARKIIVLYQQALKEERTAREKAEAKAKEVEEWGREGWELATYEIGGVPHYWKDRAEKWERRALLHFSGSVAAARAAALREAAALVKDNLRLAPEAGAELEARILSLIPQEPVSHD